LIDLLKAKERVKDVASNPLILSLICLVHRRRLDLPRGRAALYEECLEILLEVWDRDDKDLDQQFPSYEQKRHLLQRIAHRMHSKRIREIDRRDLEALVFEFLPDVGGLDAAETLVRRIEVRSGIIVERSIDRMAFAHLTLQEYLVSQYFIKEQEELFYSFYKIDDWAAWREPLLLMFGDRTMSRRLLPALSSVQPALAISGIVEIDPASLDRLHAKELVEAFITQVNEHSSLLQDGLPALVGLLGLEEDPFGSIVENFIGDLGRGTDPHQFQTLLDALSRTASPENAWVLLSLLATKPGQEMRNAVYAALGRIGDLAIRQARVLLDKGTLETDTYFGILGATATPAAATALWELCNLEPPPDREVEWALAWGSKLTDPEVEEVLHEISVEGAAPTYDPMMWPYRTGDRSALAGIAVASIARLQHRFGTLLEIAASLQVFTSLSLKICFPLLIGSFGRVLPPNTTTDEGMALRQARDAIVRALQIPSLAIRVGFGFWYGSFWYGSFRRRRLFFGAGIRPTFLDDSAVKDWWIGLRYYIERSHRRRPTTMRAIGSLSCPFVVGMCCVAYTLALRSYLPPSGTFIGFWWWLPIWGKALVSLILLGPGSILVGFLAADDRDFSVLTLLPVSLVMNMILILSPLVFWLLFISVTAPDIYERAFIHRRFEQGLHMTIALASAACGAVAGLSASRYFGLHLWTASITGAVFGIASILAVWLQGTSRAFAENPVADWLQSYSRGEEILRESNR
jgi:hypothetical protein